MRLLRLNMQVWGEVTEVEYASVGEVTEVEYASVG